MLAAAPTEKIPLTTAPSIDIHVTYSYMLGLYTTLSRLVLVFRQLYASAGGNFAFLLSRQTTPLECKNFLVLF